MTHRPIPPRRDLNGPAVHIRLEPRASWGEIAVMVAVAALIGAMLAIGGL